MEHRSHHTIIVYVLLALVAAGLIYTYFSDREEGTWQCLNVACTITAGPDVWIQQNCFETQVEGQNIVVCQVQLNGANQLIPLAELNLTNIQVCVEYACVQEVNVRAVNYTINMTQQP